MRPDALLALLLAGSPNSDEPPRLETLIAFADPARCAPTPQFQAILDVFIVRNGKYWGPGRGIVPDGFGEVQYVMGNAYFVDAGSRIHGDWHGLDARGVGLTYKPPASAPTLQLTFNASRKRTRIVLEGLGLRFGRQPGVTITLKSWRGTTSLYCEPNTV